MPQRAPPSRPFASAPNRAGPTRLFASVPKSLSTSTVAQERSPRRAANEPWGVGTDEGDAADDAAAHRAALALDSILIIFADPLDEILRGKKRYEIRGKRCPSKLGTRVWLAAYGSSAITGSAYVAACHGPLDTNT